MQKNVEFRLDFFLISCQKNHTECKFYQKSPRNKNVMRIEFSKFPLIKNTFY